MYFTQERLFQSVRVVLQVLESNVFLCFRCMRKKQPPSFLISSSYFFYYYFFEKELLADNKIHFNVTLF